MSLTQLRGHRILRAEYSGHAGELLVEIQPSSRLVARLFYSSFIAVQVQSGGREVMEGLKHSWNRSLFHLTPTHCLALKTPQKDLSLVSEQAALLKWRIRMEAKSSALLLRLNLRTSFAGPAPCVSLGVLVLERVGETALRKHLEISAHIFYLSQP